MKEAMKIGYVARHDGNGNDDEGAIYHALQALGHEVFRVREIVGERVTRLANLDLVLFHKWEHLGKIEQIKMPKVFWYFDLVDAKDPQVQGRSESRMRWIRQVTNISDLGFCTDGDWVAQDTSGKLHWLLQGADERVVGRKSCSRTMVPILFTGACRNGSARARFVYEMKARYGDKFCHVSQGVYGEKLGELIASACMVVAPYGPVTDRYWSNRVYLTAGFGGFIIHPFSVGLCRHYSGDEVCYYGDTDSLHGIIDYAFKHPDWGPRLGTNALRRTISNHLYRHRLKEMLQVVRDRLGTF